MTAKSDMVAVIILALMTAYFLVRMDTADTIITVLRYGFCFLASTIHLVGLMNRGSSK